MIPKDNRLVNSHINHLLRCQSLPFPRAMDRPSTHNESGDANANKMASASSTPPKTVAPRHPGIPKKKDRGKNLGMKSSIHFRSKDFDPFDMGFPTFDSPTWVCVNQDSSRLTCRTAGKEHESDLLPMLQYSICSYPLVNVYITMENHHFSWENPLQIAIFNSYVSLPEAICYIATPQQNRNFSPERENRTFLKHLFGVAEVGGGVVL